MILNERDTNEGLLVSVSAPDAGGGPCEAGPAPRTVEEEFYGGETVWEDEGVDSRAGCGVANIVGEESVDVAVEPGFVDEDNVLDVDGTRHAQLLWL